MDCLRAAALLVENLDFDRDRLEAALADPAWVGMNMEAYVFAGAILVVALISTVFLREVPLTGAKTGVGFDAPVEEAAGEEERSVATA